MWHIITICIGLKQYFDADVRGYIYYSSLMCTNHPICRHTTHIAQLKDKTGKKLYIKAIFTGTRDDQIKFFFFF